MIDEDFSDNDDEEVEEVEPEERHISYREKLSRARKRRKVTVPLTFDGREAGTATIDEDGEVHLTLNQSKVGQQMIRLFHQQYLNELSLEGVLRPANEVGAPGHKRNRKKSSGV